jgi:hypothetical protein
MRWLQEVIADKAKHKSTLEHSDVNIRSQVCVMAAPLRHGAIRIPFLGLIPVWRCYDRHPRKRLTV